MGVQIPPAPKLSFYMVGDVGWNVNSAAEAL